jgi:hypothetical protein
MKGAEEKMNFVYFLSRQVFGKTGGESLRFASEASYKLNGTGNVTKLEDKILTELKLKCESNLYLVC